MNHVTDWEAIELGFQQVGYYRCVVISDDTTEVAESLPELAYDLDIGLEQDVKLVINGEPCTVGELYTQLGRLDLLPVVNHVRF